MTIKKQSMPQMISDATEFISLMEIKNVARIKGNSLFQQQYFSKISDEFIKPKSGIVG